jgi:hypothetical protein
MKRATATWTVITHPFACLIEVANPFERVRKERPGMHAYTLQLHRYACHGRKLSLSWGGADL